MPGISHGTGLDCSIRTISLCDWHEKKNFVLIIFLLFSIYQVCPVLADDISVKDIQGHSYIVLTTEKPIKVSAFEVTLAYPNETSIQSMSMLQPFTSFSNIENEKGVAKVVGFVENPDKLYQETTINPLAEIVFSGPGIFNITVEELEDFNRNPILVKNIVIPVSTISTPETLLPYNLEPVQQSPVDVNVIKPASESKDSSFQGSPNEINQIINGSIITTQVFPDQSSQTPNETVLQTGTGNGNIGTQEESLPASQMPRENVSSLTTSGKGTSAALPLPIVLLAATVGCIIHVLTTKKE